LFRGITNASLSLLTSKSGYAFSGLFCIARKLAPNELDEITPVQQFTTQIGKKQLRPALPT
jgi:hypothetical protein